MGVGAFAAPERTASFQRSLHLKFRAASSSDESHLPDRHRVSPRARHDVVIHSRSRHRALSVPVVETTACLLARLCGRLADFSTRDRARIRKRAITASAGLQRACRLGFRQLRLCRRCDDLLLGFAVSGKGRERRYAMSPSSANMRGHARPPIRPSGSSRCRRPT